MKEFIKEIIFWGIFLGIIVIMWGIAEILASVITMQFIMKIVVITIIAGSIYILKMSKEV